MVYTCYLLNKEYVANNLCENRDKPKMHCDGKCHLSKQLKQTEQNESKSLAGFFKASEETVCNQFLLNGISFYSDWTETHLIAYPSAALLKGETGLVKPPPQVIS